MPCDWPHDNFSSSHLQVAWKVYCYKCSTPRDANRHSGPDGILPPFLLQTNLGCGWPSRTRQWKLTSSPSLTVKLSFGSISMVGLTEIEYDMLFWHWFSIAKGYKWLFVDKLKYLKYLKDIVDKFSSLLHYCWYCGVEIIWDQSSGLQVGIMQILSKSD